MSVSNYVVSSGDRHSVNGKANKARNKDMTSTGNNNNNKSVRRSCANKAHTEGPNYHRQQENRNGEITVKESNDDNVTQPVIIDTSTEEVEGIDNNKKLIPVVETTNETGDLGLTTTTTCDSDKISEEDFVDNRPSDSDTPPSPNPNENVLIVEPPEPVDTIDIDIVMEKENRHPGMGRPHSTTPSRLSVHTPIRNRPGSRRLQSSDLSRPSTRAGSRTSSVMTGGRKIARRNKSRPQSSSTFGGDAFRREGASESETSDNEDAHTRATSDLMDFGGMDIFSDAGWDTDLEIEGVTDDKEAFDVTGRAVYMDSCKQNKVIPASYFLRHMKDISLEMKHHGLGPQGARPIAVALVSNTNVTRLNLTDNWLGLEGGTHICEMLKENCYISELNLSDNHLGSEFAQKFSDVLNNNNSLTHITLAGNLLDDRAAIYLADGMMNTTKVEYLNLSKNKFGEFGGIVLGPAISENSSIKHLDLSWNSIRRRGAVAVAAGIKQNVLMQKINLSWNGFGNDGAKALGDALKVNCTLEELDISNNRISAEGSVLLGKGMIHNETLKHLKMGKNPMQTAGCYAICAAILKNPNAIIQKLDFSDIKVDDDFLDIYAKVKEQLPSIQLHHGEHKMPKKPKARVHPMVKLKNYIEKHNMRLVDFFNKFDKDHSMSVTREEFAQGLEESGIKLTEEEVTLLLDELDRDGDGEINYSELVMGHQDFTEKERKMHTTIMQIRPSQEGHWKN